MAEEKTIATEQQQDEGQIRAVRVAKLEELVLSGKNPYEQTRFEATHKSADIKDNAGEIDGQTVKVAGRLMSKRIMGKAGFAHVSDSAGQIQIYLKSDNLGERYAEVKRYDIGDIVGVEGEVFTTHKGEVSVAVKDITLLSKSLLPLPEKWHGLKDNDLRYRQRYVDLIANPEVREVFKKRAKIISAIRKTLDEREFVEVETPILNTIAGGAAARPFITHHNTLNLDMYMRIAPELYLKRLIVGGLDRVYELGRMFRNEGMDVKHNPEFTMVEMYQAYADYNVMMELTEQIYESVINALGCGEKIVYQGTELNFRRPWQRLTMKEAVKKFAGIDFEGMDVKKAKTAF